jgi:hypothetical protein
MISPLPKVKRAPNPRVAEKPPQFDIDDAEKTANHKMDRVSINAMEEGAPEGFATSPFAEIELESTAGEV